MLASLRRKTDHDPEPTELCSFAKRPRPQLIDSPCGGSGIADSCMVARLIERHVLAQLPRRLYCLRVELAALQRFHVILAVVPHCFMNVLVW